MNKKLVIGLGSGRCGTVSLRDLLKHQGFDASHELKLLPWEHNHELCSCVVNDVVNRQSELVSDIGYYYLRYVTYIMCHHPETKFVCLQRDKDETILSFLKFSRYNYWSYPYINREETEWDATFPTYDSMSKAEALAKYWDEYYYTAKQLTYLFPDKVQIFDMNETFNTEKGQKKLFDFIGIDGKIKLGINRHANPPDRPIKYV